MNKTSHFISVMTQNNLFINCGPKCPRTTHITYVYSTFIKSNILVTHPSNEWLPYIYFIYFFWRTLYFFLNQGIHVFNMSIQLKIYMYVKQVYLVRVVFSEKNILIHFSRKKIFWVVTLVCINLWVVLYNNHKIKKMHTW